MTAKQLFNNLMKCHNGDVDAATAEWREFCQRPVARSRGMLRVMNGVFGLLADARTMNAPTSKAA